LINLVSQIGIICLKLNDCLFIKVRFSIQLGLTNTKELLSKLKNLRSSRSLIGSPETMTDVVKNVLKSPS
jgi:hypothetical protein